MGELFIPVATVDGVHVLEVLRAAPPPPVMPRLPRGKALVKTVRAAGESVS